MQAAGLWGLTPLHEAAAEDHVHVIDYLLSVGADVNTPTNDGSTPLILAAAWGSLDAVKVLMDKGADPNLMTADGLTAMDCAMEKGEDAAANLITSVLNSR